MYKIKYKTITVIVPGDKPASCDCCAKTPDPRGLGFHHWKYAYTVKEVRENPELAKENGNWLCFYEHRIGNCMRIIDENPERVKILEILRTKALGGLI